MSDLNENSFENRMIRLSQAIEKANAQTRRLEAMEQAHFEMIRWQQQVNAVEKAVQERKALAQ